MLRTGVLFMSFALTTTAFQDGGEIAKKFTCSGADLSPAFSWSSTPAQTRSLALTADDPDAPAGTWTHWALWNIPPHPGGLPEGIPADPELKNGARQGRNDFGRIGYGGPCPPPGKPHRYFFRIYALDTVLPLKAGSSKADLQSAMKGHVLAESAWMGTFRR